MTDIYIRAAQATDRARILPLATRLHDFGPPPGRLPDFFTHERHGHVSDLVVAQRGENRGVGPIYSRRRTSPLEPGVVDTGLFSHVRPEVQAGWRSGRVGRANSSYKDRPLALSNCTCLPHPCVTKRFSH